MPPPSSSLRPSCHQQQRPHLHFSTSKASKLRTLAASVSLSIAVTGRDGASIGYQLLRRQYLYVFTSKASKLGAPRAGGCSSSSSSDVSICTFAVVKQVNWVHLAQARFLLCSHVSIRQHTSAYVSIRKLGAPRAGALPPPQPRAACVQQLAQRVAAAALRGAKKGEKKKPKTRSFTSETQQN